MGAKNHAVIMPDADPEDVIANLVGAANGATG
jgi:acyl-CoA reductase-like NAD-dependent aldehyde dehydrogenase